VVQVAPQPLVPGVGHGPGAGQRGRRDGHPAGHRALEVLLVVLGEAVDLGPEPGQRIAPGPRLEPAQPLADVGVEPGLGLLAVADHVEPGRALPGHHVGDGRALLRGEFGRIDGLARGRRPHQVEQPGRPGQAADVGGADAIGAALHDR
jgi:hypothetical protein